MTSRYAQFYRTVVRPDLAHKLGYSNVHQVPKVDQITVSIATKLESSGLNNPVPAAFVLELITGQQAKFTRIRRSNARYKVRQGMLEGAKVGLHGDSMYEFMDKLVTQVLPRVTDFDGLDPKKFDGQGNYAVGIKDWFAFLEVDAQDLELRRLGVASAPGLGVLVRTTAKTDDEARVLLSALRFPFR